MNQAPINSSDVTVFIISGLLVLSLLIGFIIYFVLSYRHKQKDFQLLQDQKKQIDNQNQQLAEALKEVQSTQAQLIQSEKMASLGELTAGIAHEIQNPLNFVNNFAEVNTELMQELKESLDSGHYEEAQALCSDVLQNMEKINFHGQRAGGIVKGMLQHSRNSSDSKEPTDLNNLADEYLRLSYHGLRAKDKTFNAKFDTILDPNVGKVDMVPQDIGRVILNLLTNAFYAVNEKKKKWDAQGKPFEPYVKVETIREKDKVILRVTDNGEGIPDAIKDKIFQPFFTTKPTGNGTGLGLSISYDIITKEHNGKLEVKSHVEGEEGTQFVITLNA